MAAEQKILLLGATGMLGTAWRNLLRALKVDFDAPPRDFFDITQPPEIDKNVSMVVNCAAFTNVDRAETDEPGAHMLNGIAPSMLAQRCIEADAKLVHYSTDYVFDGKANEPYAIDRVRHPINAYGRSKAAGETGIIESGVDHLIIRTSWLYAPWGNNFVLKIIKLLQERDVFQVVHDQHGRPTSCAHLAYMSWQLLEKGGRGVAHICDGGQCTWYEFASEIATYVENPGKVNPCTAGDFASATTRPAYSVLDLTAVEQAIGSMPHWKDNLRDVMRALGRKKVNAS